MSYPRICIEIECDQKHQEIFQSVKLLFPSHKVYIEYIPKNIKSEREELEKDLLDAILALNMRLRFNEEKRHIDEKQNRQFLNDLVKLAQKSFLQMHRN